MGRAEFQKSGLITPPKQKKVVLTAGADLRSSLKPYPARHSEDSMLSYLCLQGSKGSGAIKSCFKARRGHETLSYPPLAFWQE